MIAKGLFHLSGGLLWLAVTSDGVAQRQIGYSVGSVEAKAYLHNQGRFSGSLIDNPKVALWNTPIGEGTVGGPADDTFLEVMVLGPPRDHPEGLLLRVVSFTETDTLLDRTIEVGRFNTNGRFYTAYWLYDTGCWPITVDVRLTGKGAGQGVTKLIPYECGE